MMRFLATALWVLTTVVVLWGAVGGEGVRGMHYSCESSSFAFCDISKSFDERVKDLISRLTLDEKIQQLGNTAPGIPRLNITNYEWWQEALHGVAISPGVKFDGAIGAATSFPQPILTAASFNNTLFNKIAQVVSTEARAMYNSGQTGLTFWSPNVNIFRDPRWGRGQETPGEDPLLSSNYASNFVRGMQEDEGTTQRSEDPNFRLKTSSCCKHFTAYDLEGWGGVDRDHFDALVTTQDMEDTFNPPFQSCVEVGRASSLMCSYNRVNGVPACASHNLLTRTAREKWKFQGYIVSDCDAVYDMINDPKKYAETLEDAVADALQAGMDLNCGITISNHGRAAMNGSKLLEEDLDRALTNLMLVRMRLGLFDGPPETQTYGNLGPKDVCTQEHQYLALEAAMQGIVLLKNDNQTLPFSGESNLSLTLVGPSAANEDYRMIGSYYGEPCTYISPLEGLVRFVDHFVYKPGCSSISCEEDDFSDVSAAASKTDAVVIVVGLDQNEEREGADRTSLLLPGHQQELVSSVARASKGPVVLVIMSGGPVDISFAKDDPRISSILWVGYPGQAGGQAIAEIIFGKRSPGGKLPMTWYPESFTRVNMTDMHMRPDSSRGYPGRTYRFYNEEPVYHFGEGLSYTNFCHRVKSAPSFLLAPTLKQQACYHGHKSIEGHVGRCTDNDLNGCEDSIFNLEIGVRNEGPRSGSHVLMLYFTPPGSGKDGLPLRQLIAYERVHLEVESEYTWSLAINACRDLSTLKPNGERVLDTGEHLLSVGEVQHSIMFVDVRDHDSSKSFLKTEVTSSSGEVFRL